MIITVDAVTGEFTARELTAAEEKARKELAAESKAEREALEAARN